VAGEKRVINPGAALPAQVTYSPAVVKGGMVFISGLNAINDAGELEYSGDIAGQCRVIFEKLSKILAAAGGSLSDVVKTTDFIIDRTGYRETAAIRREYLGPVFPAATGVVVKELFGRGVLIEIDAIAVL
jgi:2-iminobutanoate/2-iminopropanoate deaminase